MFSNPVGVTERIEATPINKASGLPKPTSGTVSWASSDPAIATATVNAGAAGGFQVDVKGLAAGTVTITGTGQDVQTPPHSFSDSFQYVAAAVVEAQADGFTFKDLGPV
jgi:uncharacterized protein YjdB